MARPIKKRNKPYDPNKHHDPKEVHQLGQVTLVVLAQLQEAIIHLNNAKANLLSKAAVDDWGYPTGQVLEFMPIDFKAGTVTVIMKGSIKDTPTKPADADKE